MNIIGHTRENVTHETDKIRKEEKLIKNEHVREIFESVFDTITLNVVYELARRKYFESVEFVIATGKEGNTFRCNAGTGFYALKIYKIETSDFKHMMDYIQGDERFKNVRKDKQEIVKAWTKKEYRNLTDLVKAKVRAPLPIAVQRNCLVMEFIGKNGVAAPKAKDKPFLDMQKAYDTLTEYIAKMYHANLVHSDLSEYNILNNDEELVIIDVGQMVTIQHPKAREFFERDVLNCAKWFNKNGVKVDYDKMYADIKAKSDSKK